MNDNQSQTQSEKAREGVEHLQSAAFEVIAALRSFLDLAEDLVRDPASAAVLAASVAEAARATPPETDEGGAATSAAGGITRIRIS